MLETFSGAAFEYSIFFYFDVCAFKMLFIEINKIQNQRTQVDSYDIKTKVITKINY